MDGTTLRGAAHGDLLVTADRLKDGDFAFRATRTAGRSELACLGRALNALACALEERERARVDAEERLHNLAATLEERGDCRQLHQPIDRPDYGAACRRGNYSEGRCAGGRRRRPHRHTRPRARAAGADSRRPVDCSVHVYAADHPHRQCSREPVQRLTLDAASPAVSFLMGKGPLLGLGEGGPQFDRKGIVDRGRNGQGGYQLRTHGGRVPIQWLVGTDGWGMYVHQPLGAFDLTGEEGRLTPLNDALPLDVFVTASSDPKSSLANTKYHRPRGAAGPVDVRLHAVAPDARGARRSEGGYVPSNTTEPSK